jgi:hypothetical protein
VQAVSHLEPREGLVPGSIAKLWMMPHSGARTNSLTRRPMLGDTSSALVAAGFDQPPERPLASTVRLSPSSKGTIGR